MNDVIAALQQRLELQRDSRLPLYAQLRDGLRAWLLEQPVGSRVPSERALTEISGVNRRTLRKAIEELGDVGLLERRGRRLFVTHPGEAALPEPHAFMVHSPMSANALRRLTFASYERLPWQRQAWQALADRFAELHPDILVDIAWVPWEVNTLELYDAFVRERQADVALFSKAVLRALGQRRRLTPLPDAVLERLRGPDFLVDGVFQNAPDGLSIYGAPLHLNLWLCLWNQDLATRGGATLPPQPSLEDLFDWLVALAPGLPEHIALLANPLEFMSILGQPHAPFSVAAAETLVTRYIDLARRLAPIRHRLIFSGGGELRPDHVQAFVDGRAVCVFGHSYYLMGGAASAPFPWQMTVPVIPPDYYLNSTMTEIAICADCRDPVAATEWVQFLLSRDAQRIFASERVNCPIRHDTFSVLDIAARQTPADSLVRMVTAMRHYDVPNETWSQYKLNVLRPLLEACIHGSESFANLNPRHLVETAMQRIPSAFLSAPGAAH